MFFSPAKTDFNTPDWQIIVAGDTDTVDWVFGKQSVMVLSHLMGFALLYPSYGPGTVAWVLGKQSFVISRHDSLG
ncbi:hypothetical protein RO575_20905 [Methylomonas sp. MO1]|uniref:hypothetical protein n=1 Tax=Methylomonas sp. MO1 TaxID=3073619 RepID=UPI0028A54A8E|nr:hypothetical protein [Methylomonas sp. MO1]MDT4292030.1 hypothetical protein [Methylomonas sp. MO1]